MAALLGRQRWRQDAMLGQGEEFRISSERRNGHGGLGLTLGECIYSKETQWPTLTFLSPAQWHMDPCLHRPNLHAPRLDRSDPPSLQQAKRFRLRRRRPQLPQQPPQKLRNDHLAAKRHAQITRPPHHEPAPGTRRAPVAVPALATVALEPVHDRLLRQQQGSRLPKPAPELLPAPRGRLQEPEAELFDAAAAAGRGEASAAADDDADGPLEPREAPLSARGQGEHGVDVLLGVRLGSDDDVCSADYARRVLQQAGRVITPLGRNKHSLSGFCSITNVYYYYYYYTIVLVVVDSELYYSWHSRLSEGIWGGGVRGQMRSFVCECVFVYRI